nr:acyl-CoA-binding domain-containing protein 3-like [Coffea arabica]
MGLFLELLLTAFVALVFSFVIAKLVSVAVPSSSEEKNLDQKVGAEEVKVDKGLKVGRAKSKKRRVKFVDDVVVGNVVHLESSEEPVKNFHTSESISEKVGILDKSLEADYGFGGEKVDKKSEVLRAYGEKLVEERAHENMTRDAKDGDVEGKKGSEDVQLLDEAIDGEAVEGKKEVATFGELCSEKNEEVVGSGFRDVLVGEEMKTEGIGGEDGLKLMSDGSDQNDVVEGKKASKDVELLDESFHREAVGEKNEHAKFGDLCSVKNEVVVGSGLGGVVIGEEIKTESTGDENELKLMSYESNQNDAAAGEKLAANAEYLNKELDREAVYERGKHTAIDADKVYDSNTQMVSGNLDDLVVSVKVKSEVKLAYDDISLPQNEEGRVVSTKEGNAIGIVEDLSKENEGVEDKYILRDEKIDHSAASDDDDWEGIERSELEKVFAEAVNYVEYGAKRKDEQLVSLGSDVLVQLYALHKLALEGPCHDPQPMALMFSARAKWNAWQQLGNMRPEVAMEEYIKILSDNNPGWMQHSSAEDERHGSLKSETGVCGNPDTESSSVQDPQISFEVGKTKNEKVD